MHRGAANEYEHEPMRSPYSWPLLGLLIERPSYGYELMHRFERVYGDALTVTGPRRIYDALEELQDRGLIGEVEARQTQSRRPKVHYQATEKGLISYQDWLIEQIIQERESARLFARRLLMLEPHNALEVLDRYEQECVKEANLAQASEPALAGESAEGLVERLAQEDERLTLGVRLSWFEFARGEVRKLIEARASRQADEARLAAERPGDKP